ncbi:MAG: YbcC family protein [Bacteroidia bacterium]
MEQKSAFDWGETIAHVKHLLPHQAPLKDFIHHNTLHAFQHKPFHEGLKEAAQLFGYRVYAKLDEYRKWYAEGQIHPAVLTRVIQERYSYDQLPAWMHKLEHQDYPEFSSAQVGRLRAQWKQLYHINMDKEVHALLFRLLGAFLDQGISRWEMPDSQSHFLSAIRAMETAQPGCVLRSEKRRKQLLDLTLNPEVLLTELLGDESLFAIYVEDQQFSHPGWSGMVAFLEQNPQALMEPRIISLSDLITLELLMELDILDRKLGAEFAPMSQGLKDWSGQPVSLSPIELELYEVLSIWQEAMEYSLYDQVLNAVLSSGNRQAKNPEFQAVFCIDDREESLRRHLECSNEGIETWGTAGFFSVPIYFQSSGARHLTKVCPAPMTPKHVVRESESKPRHSQDLHVQNLHHGGFKAWLSSQWAGLSAGLQLSKSIFKPSPTPVQVSSFHHMDPQGKLHLDRECNLDSNGLQWGFESSEMVQSVHSFLNAMGMTQRFAPMIYVIGHGASSVNNTHYAGYDCGACSGRSGSVNARLLAIMANREDVRKGLAELGLHIPTSTRFVGALHDTTRDEWTWFDDDQWTAEQHKRHEEFQQAMAQALTHNAAERSRRFESIAHSDSLEKRHEQVKRRSLSLFEPRPEWNHATNALCLVGPRSSSRSIFLDRRAFLQSYQPDLDPNGAYLLPILNAVAPVCGGINLEYYFSRVDNENLGAGSKLPHNVMGLFGVVNGIDGDLRTGLPKQMINIHKPLRLMALVEQNPSVVLQVLNQSPSTAVWFINEWVWLMVKDPETGHLFRLFKGNLMPYYPSECEVPRMQAQVNSVLKPGDLPIALCEFSEMEVPV